MTGVLGVDPGFVGYPEASEKLDLAIQTTSLCENGVLESYIGIISVSRFKYSFNTFNRCCK